MASLSPLVSVEGIIAVGGAAGKSEQQTLSRTIELHDQSRAVVSSHSGNTKSRDWSRIRGSGQDTGRPDSSSIAYAAAPVKP